MAPAKGSTVSADRTRPGNPLTNSYQAGDGRWLYLVLLQADRFWAELCRRLDRPVLIEDPRFADAKVRFDNRTACVAELDLAFAAHTEEILIEAGLTWDDIAELHGQGALG